MLRRKENPGTASFVHIVPMKSHYSLTDAQFEQQFANAVLDPAVFTHEAHLRLAWIHLNQYGLETAIENVVQQLKHYTKAVGAADKYNETVTIAAVYAVQHFKIRSSSSDFVTFLSENSQLKTNFKDLLNTHYQTNIFQSAHAKATFLAPELLPFD
jgi:hypothetical protein